MTASVGIPENFRCYRGAGCDRCGQVGTHGRVAVTEFLLAGPEMRKSIAHQPSVDELREVAVGAGLISMRDSAIEHVTAGTIPLREIPRILTAEQMTGGH